LRQCPTRYAFRAGRNLPDKEFRYLRTVIVTAAVHRGFISELAPLHLTFRHWAGVSPYTSSYEFAETCVFVKQSVGPFLCGPGQLHKYLFHWPGRSFSRSYGSILPSSLTRVLPIALVFSTRLPVSVCGTGTTASTLRGFSRQYGLNHFWPYGLRIQLLRLLSRIYLRGSSPYEFSTGATITRLAYPPASPHHSTMVVQEY
jgi:hypothetical protein